MSDDAAERERDLLSPVSATSQQPQWPRPRTPIDPRRLAKLANALGISTPVPVRTNSDSAMHSSSRSASETWRSQTPSTASASNLSVHTTSPSYQSKFLLHVIPPAHLPHDNNAADVLLTPPPATASGYHTQFRRGTLVPLLPSFQAQLGAIAKEYALPSTTGMILYLVTSTSTPSSSLSPSPVPSLYDRESLSDRSEEPGPRLSEDIWKHLWTRVVRTELGGYSSRVGTPISLGLNASASPGTTPTLRPLMSSGSKPPLTPTTSSTISSSTNGASETSQSDATTPDTSLPPESNADLFDLPGLHSPSLIPILTKVEFDIDKRKAAWYGPWLRSRKHNYHKRIPRHTSEDSAESEPRLHLKIVDRQAKPRFLSSGEDEDESGDEPEYEPRMLSPEEEEDLTARLDQPLKKLPPRLILPINDSDLVATGEPSPGPPSSKLAYRESDTEDEAGGAHKEQPKRSPLEEKRGGAFFDDLVLGLRFTDTSDYDDDDPSDRRRSQFLMQQRLDEIERNLQQFSPRKLKYEDELPPVSSTPPRSSAFKSQQFLSPTSHPASLHDTTSSAQPELGSDVPRWPAVPYSQLNGDGDSSADTSLAVNDFPAPPKFALNGVSNAIPLSPYKQTFSDDIESEESKARRREHTEGQTPSYPAVIPPSLRSPQRSDSDKVIPLSPDPFGRFPSEPIPPVPPVPPVPPLPSRVSESSHRSSSSQSRTAFSFDSPESTGLERDDSMSSVSDKHTSTKLSSRFSLDSDDHHTLQRGQARSSAQSGSASLNPVKSIRTLWRKSRKSSVSGERPTPAPGPVPRVPSISGGQVHAQAQSQSQSLGVPMPRVSEELVTNAMLPPGHPRRGPAHPDAAAAMGPMGGLSMTTAEAKQRAHGEQSISAIHFDQESPYPIRRAQASRAPSPNMQATQLPPSPVPPSPRLSQESDLPADPKGSTRKSILKSWRGNGSSGEGDAVAPRKRRPSVMDVVRSSRTSVEPIPPSPMLPDQFANQLNSRTARTSGSSMHSSYSNAPRAVSSGPADETFEIVDSAVGGGHAKAPSLSYPYHELDHQP